MSDVERADEGELEPTRAVFVASFPSRAEAERAALSLASGSRYNCVVSDDGTVTYVTPRGELL